MYGERDNLVFNSNEDNGKKQWNEFSQATRELLHELSIGGTTQEFLDKVVNLIQRESGCSFVGIRVLNDSGYIPYQSYVGFSREFWEEENMIQVSHEDCGCTRIVSGNLRACDKKVINEAGSLLINNTKTFSETLSEDELLVYRGACVRSGYQSIAVIPIICGKAVMGLIHLADLQPGKLSPEIMAFTESIAPLVGEVLNKEKIEWRLKNIEKQKKMLESIVGGVGNLAYVVNLDTFELIYCQEKIFGPSAAGRKCYELFGLSTPCPNCSQTALAGAGSLIDHWEHYDSSADRYYFAEKKNISWVDGEIIHGAFVTDITNHKKAEEALKDSINELQQLSASLEEEIMERQAAQEALRENTERFRRKALTDILTGLPNRAYLNECLEDELAKTRTQEGKGAVLFVDLDDLKTVNDTFGHKHGDALIISAGKLILAETGGDALVARVGGDEFIIILPGKCSRQELAGVADRLIRTLQYEHNVLGVRLYTSASIGVAIYPEDGNTVEEISKNADNAMYAAKRAGKNCWRFYDESMQMETYERVTLTSSLRSALELGELAVMYQPQLTAKGHTVAGFEALLRWVSPQHGSISPVRFIPLAEKSGLIQPIGQWVIQEACRFVEKLVTGGWENISVAVNVSPYQLAHEGFVDMVRETLDRFKIRPNQLEMEITETALIASMENTLRILHELNTLGVRLALDDFGTGYSSLTHLHCLPVQTLKIDKSFIDRIIINKLDSVMIKSIVTMAHSRRMSVVAEGVETKSQLDFLTKSRCDLIQGYFFSKPLPTDAALRFLQQHA